VAFPWETRIDFGNGIAKWFRGLDASITPPLLYPMPMFSQADRREDMLIVEGESDQEAAQARGVLAFTAGAAGAFGIEHARLLRGWRGRVTVLRDNDLPGAWGAAKAYDLLRDVGIPASRLRVARGRCTGTGTDLRDHLDAGYTVEQLISEPIAKVRKLAAKATSESFTAAGYPDGINPRTGYVTLSPDELAGLKTWKPVAS
jgi:hypothetical protein